MHVMRQFSVSCLSKDNDFRARVAGFHVCDSFNICNCLGTVKCENGYKCEKFTNVHGG